MRVRLCSFPSVRALAYRSSARCWPTHLQESTSLSLFRGSSSWPVRKSESETRHGVIRNTIFTGFSQTLLLFCPCAPVKCGCRSIRVCACWRVCVSYSYVGVYLWPLFCLQFQRCCFVEPCSYRADLFIHCICAHRGKAVGRGLQYAKRFRHGTTRFLVYYRGDFFTLQYEVHNMTRSDTTCR